MSGVTAQEQCVEGKPVSFREQLLERALTLRNKNDEDDPQAKAVREIGKKLTSQLNHLEDSCFNNPDFSDAKIVVKSGEESRTYHVNKLALVSRSEYFKTLFMSSSQWSENETGEVQLKADSIGLDFIEEFLRYFYSGTIELRKCNIWPYYFLADRYLVKQLKELISKFVCETMLRCEGDSDGHKYYGICGNFSVDEALEFVQHFDCGEVSQFAGAVILNQLDEFTDQQFNNFPVEVIQAILKAKTLDTAVPNEFNILKRVIGWIKFDASREKHADTLLSLVRYWRITHKVQLHAISRHKYVSESAEISRLVALAIQERSLTKSYPKMSADLAEYGNRLNVNLVYLFQLRSTRDRIQLLDSWERYDCALP